MFVMTAVALFTVYSLNFYREPQFSTNASVNYIGFDNDTETYSFPTDRMTMAVSVGSYLYPSTVSKYLRVRFY